MLRSYVGPAYAPVPAESFDLLGVSLAVLAEILPEAEARLALGRYPAAAKGSPVIWPQQPDTPIYHNRAMWPFVSAYAMRAARKLNDVNRIGFELDSILEAAAANGSNMENYEITTLSKHVEDGKLSGPVVNSPRQLWSVGAMYAAIEEGVFGLQMDGKVVPKIPSDIGERLFKGQHPIEWVGPARTVRLLRPAASAKGNLWVERSRSAKGKELTIQLQAIRVNGMTAPASGAAFAPAMPSRPLIEDMAKAQDVPLAKGMRLYRNGAPVGKDGRYRYLPTRGLQCFNATQTDAQGVESLPSQTQCHAGGTIHSRLNVPTAIPSGGHYRVMQRFNNPNGPINTGITAAVKKLQVACRGMKTQNYPIVMPHSVREQDSTSVIVRVPARTTCTFKMLDGVNMSDLTVNAEYTGGKGGVDGPLNAAEYGELLISPLDWATIPTILKNQLNENSR